MLHDQPATEVCRHQRHPVVIDHCPAWSRSSRARGTLELSSIAGWHYRRTSQRSVGLVTTSSDNFARSSSRWRWKLQEPQLWRLFPADWITSIRCSTVCRTFYCASCSLCRMPLHDWSLARDAVIISRRYYANFIGYPSQSAWSSKWHVWFASHCPSRRLSTWPTTAVSCPKAIGDLCGQLTFWLAWCREHSCCCSYGDRTFAAAGPRLWNSLPVHQLHNPDITCSDDSLREGNLFWGSMNTDGALWLLMRRQNTYASAYSRAIFSMCFFRKKPRAIRIRMYEGCQLDPSNRFDRTSTCDRHIHLAIDIRDSVVKIKIIGLWRLSYS